MPVDGFDLEAFFPRRAMDLVTEVRVDFPEAVVEESRRRKRREKLTTDGKLAVLATDHPARGVTRIGDDPLRMGNRWEYLGRALRVLTTPGFDGIMGTPDFLEDLFIVSYLIRQRGGPSILDGKVLVGCMQRGGVAGVAGEIDDRFGSYTAEAIERFGLDGGKMMFRAVPDDERTLKTIDYCARAVTELARRGLYAFVEPLPMRQQDGQYLADYSVPTLVKYVGVVAGFGETSRYTWIKIPYVEGYGTVAAATTLPILMLGGESKGDPIPVLQNFARGMRAAGNVRGVMVGRNVTFPGPWDPGAVAWAVAGIVHRGVREEEAVELLRQAPERLPPTLADYF